MFIIPIALEKISWKTYIVFLATYAFEAVYYFLIMVETKGHTLEEMNEIFRAKNPKQASLVRKDKVQEAVEKMKGATSDV